MEAHADPRAILTDALRFWERLRLLYNGVLAGVHLIPLNCKFC